MQKAFDTEFMTARLSFIHQLQYSLSDREKQSPAKKWRNYLRQKMLSNGISLRTLWLKLCIFEYFFYYFVAENAGVSSMYIELEVQIQSDPRSQYKKRATRLWPFRSFNRWSSFSRNIVLRKRLSFTRDGAEVLSIAPIVQILHGA